MSKGRRRGKLPGLTQRERSVLDCLYTLGEATAVDVQARLDDDLSNATVRTILRALVDKQAVSFREDSGTYVYTPAVDRLVAAKRDFQRIALTFFGGSVHTAVANLLGSNMRDVSDAELDSLQQMIDQQRQRNARKGSRNDTD